MGSLLRKTLRDSVDDLSLSTPIGQEIIDEIEELETMDEIIDDYMSHLLARKEPKVRDMAEQ